VPPARLAAHVRLKGGISRDQQRARLPFRHCDEETLELVRTVRIENNDFNAEVWGRFPHLARLRFPPRD
jgi:hypothetical protein